MNKSIPFFIKLLSILLLVAGIVFPLLTGSGTINWISDAPTGAPAVFEGTIFEIGVLTNVLNELTYDETNAEFDLRPVTTSDAFSESITMMQIIAMIAIGVALFFFIIGALIHLKKPSKFASFLTLLGIIFAGGVVGLIIFLQTMVLAGMAQGGTQIGNSVYMDNVFNIGGTLYTWRLTAVLELGYGAYAVAAAALLSFISLFLKGDYDEY